MYAYMVGKLVVKRPTYIVLECNGIGYHLNISLETYSSVEDKETARLHTYLHVKEDSLTLFGFSQEVERELFKRLISVSGVGPSTAQIILSSMSVRDVHSAILNDNPTAFKKVKGVGPKTAQRLILDLRDKIAKSADEQLLIAASSGNTIYEEALSALVTLGFPRARVQQALSKIQKTQPGVDLVEDLIKLALNELS